MEIKNKAENAWLDSEFKKTSELKTIFDENNFLEILFDLYSEHPVSNHEIFNFLESHANIAQFLYFFKSDSALNLLFFDLISMALVGSQVNTRAEISKNLWDEIGEGNESLAHVDLYKNLLLSHDISLPDDKYIFLHDWQGLAGYNLFMMGGTTRRHYYKYLGMMAMTELTDPSQYQKLVKGGLRVGLKKDDLNYYSEHISIDINHADGWLNKVIYPIIKDEPMAMKEIYLGALLRLNTCKDYYDFMLNNIKNM